MVEQRPEKPCVGSSILLLGTIQYQTLHTCEVFLYPLKNSLSGVFYELLFRRTTTISNVSNWRCATMWISAREIFTITIDTRIGNSLISTSRIIIYPFIYTESGAKFHIRKCAFFTGNRPFTPLAELSSFISTRYSSLIPCFSFSTHRRLNTIAPHSNKS